MPEARSQPIRFMDREIQVEAAEDAPRRPKAFTVGGRRYLVTEVISTWEDEPPGSARNWHQRPHRTFYRLRTEEGELFDVYYDLGESRRRHRDRLALHRRLSTAAPASTAEPDKKPPAEAETPPQVQTPAKTRAARLAGARETAAARRSRAPKAARPAKGKATRPDSPPATSGEGHTG